LGKDGLSVKFKVGREEKVIHQGGGERLGRRVERGGKRERGDVNQGSLKIQTF